MPKMLCTCGETLFYGSIPCEIEYKFISDVQYDSVQEMVDAEDLYLKMQSFLKCSHCNRIWIFWRGFQMSPSEYVLQNE